MKNTNMTHKIVTKSTAFHPHYLIYLLERSYFRFFALIFLVSATFVAMTRGIRPVFLRIQFTHPQFVLNQQPQ